MTTLLQLTYSGLFLAVLAQQVGLPIPSVVFLIAAGALAAHGKMNPAIIVVLGVLGCLAGDGLWFWIGRKWGSKALRLLCQFTADPRSCSNKAQNTFRRHGLPVLCVAKFLPGLDAVIPPLCGAEGVPFTCFLALDTVGSLLWSSVYLGLGYHLLKPTGRSNPLGSTFWDCPRFRDWDSDRPLRRLAGTGSVQNDPSTAAAPHESADARTQTEIQEQGRRDRPFDLRRSNRQSKA